MDKRGRQNLRRELKRERNQLDGLIEATCGLIGGVALHGYNELQKIPPAFPVNSTSEGEYIHAPSVFFSDIGYETGYFIQDVHTLTKMPKRRIPILRSRVSERQVHACIKRPNEYAVHVSVSDKGYSQFENRTNLTQPRALKGNLARVYSSKEEMRVDYAKRFIGGLAVADIVATSLRREYSIAPDTSQLPALIDKWQQVGNLSQADMDDVVLRFVPGWRVGLSSLYGFSG